MAWGRFIFRRTWGSRNPLWRPSSQSSGCLHTFFPSLRLLYRGGFDCNGHHVCKPCSAVRWANLDGIHPRYLSDDRRSAELTFQTQIFNKRVQSRPAKGGDSLLFLRNPEELYKEAVQLCKNTSDPKNVAKAMKLLNKAADKGHAKSIFYLAVMYHNGDGVDKDPNRSFEQGVLKHLL